jgi:ABC-type transport system involved in multi-copper enzyme maturation permease subunit
MAAAASLIAVQSARFVLRERIVALLAWMFVTLVLISAWLGWSATSTVDRIYLDTAAFLRAAGQPVPANPVLDISPLTLLRNMVVYVALIGALAAIVIGNQLVSLDRKSGVLPLIGTRPIPAAGYAIGKMAALAGLVFGLVAIAALVSVGTLALLPQIGLSPDGWLKLAGFFAVSAVYLMLFGFLGLGAAATMRSEALGLLLPMTIWLTLTFVLPALSSNILPTAALNPISALAPVPDSGFFRWSGWLLGPVSLADAYKIACAGLLDFLPQGYAVRSPLPPVLNLVLAAALAGAWSARALITMDRTRGDYDV